MNKEIKTEILIKASPEKVWGILTQQNEYPEWNPFIKKLEGRLKVGERLKVIIQPKDSSPMTFKPIVLAYQESKILKWKGKFLVSGLFDGTHIFEIVDNMNGTITFRQSEIFKGILVGVFNLENTRKGFEEMNSALKNFCES